MSTCVLSAGEAGFEYLYWDWGQTPRRDNYQYALLATALEKTVPEYGSYQLKRVRRDFTTRRSRLEVNLGRTVNIHAAPWLKDDLSSRPSAEANLPVPVPIMGSLLGHRRLVIRKQDIAVFQQIKSSDDLKHLLLGQGNQWLDMKIYEFNRYPAGDTALIPDTLIPMLIRGRFDYIPLSVIEVKDFIEGSGIHANDVVEAPNLTLFYAFPVIYFVDKHQPHLAARLEFGLRQLADDGGFDQLFQAYFGAEIAKLKQAQNRFIHIENPFSPIDDQRSAFETRPLSKF